MVTGTGKTDGGSGHIIDCKESTLIGEGSFAKVYVVTRQGTGLVQACKVSKEKKLLQKEAAILEQVNHPLFPKFYEYREQGEEGFLYMEYIPGNTLRKVVESQGNLPKEQVLRIATQLAEGLRYLHEGTPVILFRDLKPENVIMGQDGSVGLVDFGSADVGHTTRNVVTGTKGYGAPEQWWDRERVNKCSDVYALGKVMYFLLGKGKIEKWLGDLLEDCVAIKPEERIPDMRYFLVRLREKKRRKGTFVYQQNVMRL